MRLIRLKKERCSAVEGGSLQVEETALLKKERCGEVGRQIEGESSIEEGEMS